MHAGRYDGLLISAKVTKGYFRRQLLPFSAVVMWKWAVENLKMGSCAKEREVPGQSVEMELTGRPEPHQRHFLFLS